MKRSVEIASYFHLDEEAIDIIDPKRQRRYEQPEREDEANEAD